jgi:glycosyltransferase involved in cell wall biosynthesis
MQALHVIAGLDPAHGGPSYSAPRLCAELAALGADVRLFHIDGGGGAPAEPASYELRGFAQDWAQAPILGALRLSAGLSRAIADAARTADIVHNHGIWLAPNMRSQALAQQAGKPFVCSPRGMLSAAALAFSGAKKRAVWALGQRAALERASCLHATSEMELAEVRARGLTPPVAIIPNGIDIPPPSPHPVHGQSRTLLSLGRIHPKKGLDSLLHAWSRVEAAHPDWRLRIVGPAEAGHDKELAALAASLGLARVSIEGPVYGPGKLELYQGAELFVAPTRSENFGLTIAEALAAGVPAICTKGAPWAELESERCGWWVDQGADALAAALGEALALPPEALAAMGGRGRDLVTRSYGWRRVAQDMLQLYAWLAAGGEPPAFVHTA